MAALTHIGNIQIFAEVHSGAVHTVYKGYQASLERFVIVKALRPEFNGAADLVQRFTREAKLIAKIQHPNVVAVYENGKYEQWYYFAAEFVDGFDLHQLLDRSNLPTELAFYILLETSRGLKAAHDKEILHRDIKPSNILISHEGRVKITDFGMADLRLSSEQDLGGGTTGTLAYLSPEQVLGEKVDKHSDIFSLGSTFYEMLSGSTAFWGKDSNEYFQAILHEEPAQHLHKINDMPSELIEICKKMMCRDVSDRYQNCDELLKDLMFFEEKSRLYGLENKLKSFIEEPESYQAPIIEVSNNGLSEPKKRNYTALAVISFILVALIGLGAFFVTGNIKEPVSIVVTEKKNHSEFSGVENKTDEKVTDIVELIKPYEEQSFSSNNQHGLVLDSVYFDDKPRQIVLNDLPTEKETKQTELTETGFGEVRNGRLKIICIPWAAVFVDDDSIGTTPLEEIIELPEGKHVIGFRNPDFPDFEQTIGIIADSLNLLELSMWSLVGSLNIEVSPWAEVYIDDEYRDTVPPQERPIILKPGQHKLTLKHPALGNWETEINAKAGQALELQFNLKTLLSD